MTTRQCPRDRTTLVARKVSVPGLDVTVDDCPKCQGTFLDHGEIRRVTGDKELGAYLGFARPATGAGGIACPACHWPMHVVRPDGIEVDICEKCSGVWLDGGELEALQARDRATPLSTKQEREALDYDVNRRRGPGEHQTKMVGALALGAFLGWLIGRR